MRDSRNGVNSRPLTCCCSASPDASSRIFVRVSAGTSASSGTGTATTMRYSSQARWAWNSMATPPPNQPASTGKPLRRRIERRQFVTLISNYRDAVGFRPFTRGRQIKNYLGAGTRQRSSASAPVPGRSRKYPAANHDARRRYRRSAKTRMPARCAIRLSTLRGSAIPGWRQAIANRVC